MVIARRRDRRIGVAAAASFLAAVASTPFAAHGAGGADESPSPGAAQRLGAEIDAAYVKARAWVSDEWRAFDGKRAGMTRRAGEWVEEERDALWGRRDAGRKFGVFVAVDAPTGPPQLGKPGAEMPLVWVRLCGDGFEPVCAPAPGRLVILVHGLDEPGGMWNDLAPALVARGLSVAKFDYPNDQHIADSADLLAGALRDLRAMGVRRVDLVAHSMGGLVVRDVLTRASYYAGDGEGGGEFPSVGRFIMLSTPHSGSVLAPLQPLSEAREHICRRLDALDYPDDGLFHSYADGDGEAAEDLCPRSPFLADLNSRPAPRNVAVTNIVGTLVGAERESQVAHWAGRSAAALGVENRDAVERAVRGAIGGMGDGLVSETSATWPGISDTVRVAADHRGMLQRWWPGTAAGPDGSAGNVPPAIPVILDRLRCEPVPDCP